MDINSEAWDNILTEMHKMLPPNMTDAMIVDVMHFILVQYDIDWPRTLRLTHIVNDLHATHTGEKSNPIKKLH
jgi:hypothetical protein|tara:strand:- start:1326 stop:1544 length:219 start_codon:yes stop_codon:yes gene_type:complete